MSAHTELCRGQPCYVRLSGCLPGTETVVPAHWRGIGISGAGFKAPDLLTCPACFNCHELIDRRKIMANLSRVDVRLAHAEAIFRWQCKLIKDGEIEC